MTRTNGSTQTAPARHEQCFVCGPQSDGGLGIRYEVLPDGSVRAWFDGGARFQGFGDRLHGGVIALLLDDAMTNCLLARGVSAVTGRLSVVFRSPADLDHPVEVIAWLESRDDRLYRMVAELRQQEHVRAYASAKFAEMDEEAFER